MPEEKTYEKLIADINKIIEHALEAKQRVTIKVGDRILCELIPGDNGLVQIR